MDQTFNDVKSDGEQEMKRLEAMLLAAASKPPKPELSKEAKDNLRWLQTTFNSKFTSPITQEDMFYLIGTDIYEIVDLTQLREIDEAIVYHQGKASEEDRSFINELKEHLEGELNDIESLIKTGRGRKGGSQSKRKASKRKASKRKVSKRKTHKRRKASKRKTSKRKTHKRRKASKRKVSKRK